jgi:acetoin utilization deacetylase AcuC-like enzyme
VQVKAFYSDRFALPLPEGHRFPMAKYGKLRERVETQLPGIRLFEPAAATDEQLTLVHDPSYIARITAGTLGAHEIRAIGFPWSEDMVERSRRSTAATIAACRAALDDGVAVNLAGGTHHAHRDRGQGYCVFNDAAVAARVLQADAAGSGLKLPVAVIDLDVHQGNGTASIFAGDDTVFTLSLHGQNNFPFRKESGNLDRALPDGTSDAEYLRALDQALDEMLSRFRPGLLVYLAGADAHEGDRLGKLALTTSGMQERDVRVFDLAYRLGVPIAATMAGGYGRDIEATVDVHFNTVRTAYLHWCRCSARAALEPAVA